jgi:hypothetical protein
MELCARLKPLSDGAFRVRGESFLDLVHLDPARVVARSPEQTIDEHLKTKKIKFNMKLSYRSSCYFPNAENTVLFNAAVLCPEPFLRHT